MGVRRANIPTSMHEVRMPSYGWEGVFKNSWSLYYFDVFADDLEFEKLDESDHSFKRKRPTEASWDSDDELLQEDHVPVKKVRTF